MKNLIFLFAIYNNVTQQLESENELTVKAANLLNNQLVGEGRKSKNQKKTK